MATVSRTGRTSASVKKARLEVERSKMSARMGLDYGCEETKSNEEIKKKNRFDFIFKLIIMGDTGVGKTSLLDKYLGPDLADKSEQTFIANFHNKIVEQDGHVVKLEIWDISGSDKFSHLGLMFYPGSSAVILAYDVTRRDTLDTCLARDTVLKEMEKGNYPARFLVGCKTDLEDEREVPEMDAQAVANEIGARWFELSSVVEGKVEFLMRKILRDLLDRNMPEVDTHETNGSQEMGDTETQELEVVELESDGAFGFIKKLLNLNFSDI